jgi:DNA-binding CsgD family transcriptional regulator
MSLVAGLSPSERAVFAEKVTEQQFLPGERMVAAGAASPGIYEIVSGIAEVKRPDGFTLAMLTQGDTFGEMSLLNNYVASADVIAVDTCRTLCISPESLRDITDNHASIAAKLYRRIANILSSRLRETSRRVQMPHDQDEAEWWAEHGAALDGLDRTGTATLVVDRDGKILFHDKRAELLLREGDGVKSVHGRLSSADGTAAGSLVRLVRTAADSAAECRESGLGGGVTIDRGDGVSPLSVLVTPFRPEPGGTPQAAALVLVRDPTSVSPAPQLLQDLFGLTPMEATIGARLAEGAALERIAVSMGISLSTVRSHLKNLFSKTGTARQAELVALILRSAAPLGGG